MKRILVLMLMLGLATNVFAVKLSEKIDRIFIRAQHNDATISLCDGVKVVETPVFMNYMGDENDNVYIGVTEALVPPKGQLPARMVQVPAIIYTTYRCGADPLHNEYVPCVPGAILEPITKHVVTALGWDDEVSEAEYDVAVNVIYVNIHRGADKIAAAKK